MDREVNHDPGRRIASAPASLLSSKCPYVQRRNNKAKPTPPQHTMPFQPIVTMYTDVGTKTCMYGSVDGTVFHPISTDTPVVPFPTEPSPYPDGRPQSPRKKTAKKAKVTSGSQGSSQEAESVPHVKKDGRAVFMDFYRDACRLWYFRENTGVVEGRLLTYYMNISAEERSFWEKKAADLEGSADEGAAIATADSWLEG